MTGALARIGLIAAIAVGLFLAGYAKGRHDGKVEQLRDSVEAYQKRGKINNETDALDSRALCLRLGGVRDDCDELRRMEQTAESE